MTNTTKARATKSTKTIAAACLLFGIALEESARIPAFLHALGFRETCSRCGGSGHYSFNQIDGSRCFGCAGAGERAAPLTAAVLEAARVKVEAGELETIRAAARAKKQARREIAPLDAAAREIAMNGPIAQAYGVASQAFRASWNGETGTFDAPIPAPLSLAITLSNDLYFGSYVKGGRAPGVSGIVSDVKSGARRDYLEARAEVAGLLADLEALTAAWLAFAAAEVAS